MTNLNVHRHDGLRAGLPCSNFHHPVMNTRKAWDRRAQKDNFLPVGQLALKGRDFCKKYLAELFAWSIEPNGVGLIELHADEFDRHASRLRLTEDGRAAPECSEAVLVDLNAPPKDRFEALAIDIPVSWLTSSPGESPAIMEHPHPGTPTVPKVRTVPIVERFS